MPTITCHKLSMIAYRIVRLVLVLGVSVASLSAIVPASGVKAASDSWFFTNGQMNTKRQNHTATLLQNGKVLVAGGQLGPTNALKLVELYNPANGIWSPTGPLATGRWFHTATLLPNGKVLVSGGTTDGSTAINSTELYNPADGSWSPAAPMTTARFSHTATLLPNGKVLVVGGTTGTNSLANAELYDPVGNNWADGGSGTISDARSQHTATLLSNGMVMIAGGLNGTGYLDSTELYNPGNNTWSLSDPMVTPRAQHTATALPDGSLLVAGGKNSSTLLSAEIYSPDVGWYDTGDLANARYDHSATLLPNGKVLVAGGTYTDVATSYLASAEIYDPGTLSWTSTGSLNIGLTAFTATILPSGDVLAAGGYGQGGETERSQLFTPGVVSDSTNTGSLTTARYSHTTTLLPNGKVLVAGGTGVGSGIGSFLRSCELYTPGPGTWTSTGSMVSARTNHTATLLPNGKVLVVGGVVVNTYLKTAELYDPATGTWSLTGSMTFARANHTATLLKNGKVLVTGGQADAFGNYPATAEIYNPVNGTWSPTNIMNGGRIMHTATLLKNGKVFVAGGHDLSGYRNTAEIYDPTTNVWTGASTMNTKRGNHTANLLPDGRVLVVGGSNNAGPVNTSEIYDPALNQWSIPSTMVTGRYYHSSILLPSGKVMVMGGYDGSNDLDKVEIYDPANGATGLWSISTPLKTARKYPGLSILPSGKVLVVGGSGNNNVLPDVEVYDPGSDPADLSWRPVIGSINSPLILGETLTLTGNQFQGYMFLEASDGSSNSSATNYPMVQLRRLDNEQIVWLTLNPGTSFSNTSFTSLPITNTLLPPGLALATVFANGIPSESVIIQLGTVTYFTYVSVIKK